LGRNTNILTLVHLALRRHYFQSQLSAREQVLKFIIDRANLEPESRQKIFSLIESRYLDTGTLDEVNVLDSDNDGPLTDDNLLTLVIKALCGGYCTPDECFSQV